jgi:hypothetical protein
MLESRLLLAAWYVAPTGNDSSPGSLQHPFATIQHAADLASAGDTIFIKAGTYRETVTVPHSGTASKPIMFRPYKNQKVVIDGADPLTGWTSATGGIYQTSAMTWNLGDGNNEVFANGQMLYEARWPTTPESLANLWNPTVDHITAAVIDGTSVGIVTATVTIPDLTSPAGTWVGATIHIAHGQQWVWRTGTVTASSPRSLTYTYVAPDNPTQEAPVAGNPFYLTGKLTAVDAPGEWFKDPSTSVLSLDPLSGGAPANIEVKQRLYGFDLSGDSYINITGINLFACSINSDANSNHITINSIGAQYVSQQVDVADPFSNIFHPHATGIILNGTANLIENSTIRYSSGDGVFLGGSNNAVVNCVISDTDYAGANEAAVSTLGTAERVSQNTITTCGRDGVSIYNSQVNVDHNLISSVGLLTTDLGGIYSFETDGQGSRISYNVISNIHTGGFGGTGIHLDDNSSNYVVDHNVVWNVDFAMKMNPPSTNIQVYNNTLIGATNSISSNGDMRMTDCTFANNILGGAAIIGPGATQTDDLPDTSTIAFVNAAAGDFRLKRNSIAINKGVATPYTGKYVGSAPDVGAYEFGDKPFTAGVTKSKAGNASRRSGRAASLRTILPAAR